VILYRDGFGRGRGYAGPLKLADFAALPVDLDAHSFNFGSDLVKLHDVLVRLKLFRSAADSRRRLAFLFQKPQAIPQPDDFSLFPSVHTRLEKNRTK
jgi:hypothetical protein